MQVIWMNPKATMCAVLLCSPLMLALAAQPVSVDRSIRHPVDMSPRLSADGKVLVWVRARDGKAKLCVSPAPFDAPPAGLPLGPAMAPLPPVGLSLDGRHVFWQMKGSVWHCVLKDARPATPERLPVKAGPFGLQTNGDGSVLAVLLDGPPSPRRSPSWRAVSVAVRTRGGWRQGEPITSTRQGQLARSLCLDGSGRYLVFDRGGLKQGTRGAEGWTVCELRIKGFHVRISALSADGCLMLLRGRKHHEQRERPKLAHLSHVWLSRRVDGRWQTPELVLRDRQINYYNETMSPNGRGLMWVEFDRDERSTILKTRLRLMRRDAEGWTEPQTLVEQKGFLQFRSTALANDGTAAWSTVAGNTKKSFVRTPTGATIRL